MYGLIQNNFLYTFKIYLKVLKQKVILYSKSKTYGNKIYDDTNKVLDSFNRSTVLL